MTDTTHVFHTWWLFLREVVFLSVELMLRCWVSVLGVLFFVRGTEKLWLLCSSVWSYRSLGKKSQVTVEYVELGTKHLHPQMLQDGVLRAAALASSSPSQGCCRKGYYIHIPFPGYDRKGSYIQHLLSKMLEEGILHLYPLSRMWQGFFIQQPLSRMLQEGILHPESLLRDATGRDSVSGIPSQGYCRKEGYSLPRVKSELVLWDARLDVVCHIQIHYWLHKLYGLVWEPNHLWFCVLRNYILT